jgi:hypothetical protein
VYNRRGEVVATAITNLDIHDIARASFTYGAKGVLVVNPLERQRWLMDKILAHWQTGHGALAHPNRRDALKNVRALDTLERAVGWVEESYGQSPLTVATTAKSRSEAVSYTALKDILGHHDGPVMLLFGTGWGLTDEVVQKADYVVRPILDGALYNHLSVRSAAAIILDRLCGDR